MNIEEIVVHASKLMEKPNQEKQRVYDQNRIEQRLLDQYLGGTLNRVEYQMRSGDNICWDRS